MWARAIATSFARAISPLLVFDGDLNHLFQIQFALSLVAVGLVNILQVPPGDRPQQPAR